MRKITALMTAFLVAGFVAAAAADVKLEVSANRNSLYLGESVILTVKVSGMDSPPPPDLSAITHASVKLLGSQSDNHYSIMIVNGRVTKESFSGRIFTYEIRPGVAGPFTVGPVSLTAEGRTLTESGPVVEVTGIVQQEWAILKISASRDAVLVDEPFEITLSLALKRLKAPYADNDPLDPNDPPALNVPFLDDAPIDGLTTPKVKDLLQTHLVRGRDASGFTINSYALQPDMFDMDSFFGQKKAKFLLDKQAIRNADASYFEYTVKLTYVPQREGSYTFGPAEFKGKMIVDADAQGHAIGKNIFAVGPAHTVRVVPPPEDTRPASYVGALGTNLHVDASLDTQTCNVGDPLKLTLSLSGNVRMENISPPQLNLQPDLSRNFRINEDTIGVSTKDKKKEYVYTVRPIRAGTYEFPPLEVAYYNTTERCYKTIKTQPIPIRANETFSVQESNIIFTATNQTGGDYREKVGDVLIIGPLNVDPAGAHPSSLGFRPWHVVLIVLGPLLFALMRLQRYVKSRIPQAREAEIRRHAARRAVGRLRKAGKLASNDTLGAHHLICDALRGYIGDHFGVSPAGLTPTDVRAILTKEIGDTALAGAFTAILERNFNTAFSQAGRDGTAAVEDSRNAADITQKVEEALHAASKENRL